MVAAEIMTIEVFLSTVQNNWIRGMMPLSSDNVIHVVKKLTFEHLEMEMLEPVASSLYPENTEVLCPIPEVNPSL